MQEKYDAIVVGGGHNGLVAAGYLVRAGMRVLVLEARAVLGGPAGTMEFLPGYRTAFANSPGSFERRIMVDLQLEKHGLKFLRVDPTLVHGFPAFSFLGWRDGSRVDEQLNRFATGEAERYRRLLSSLEALGQELGVSLFRPSPTIDELDSRMAGSPLSDLYGRVFHGSLEQLLDDALQSEEAKSLLAMIALNGNLLPPGEPGSGIGLMLRPISMASGSDAELTSMPLRGSSGLPVGGIGAVIDALESFITSHGGEVRTDTEVIRIVHDGDSVTGVAIRGGDEFRAPIVVSAVGPSVTFESLLVDAPIPTAVTEGLAAARPTGSAFKMVLALDGEPAYAGLPEGLVAADVNMAQFRVAPSFEYIKKSVADGIAGRATDSPIMWGLMTTATSPQLAPSGHHLLSINAWHAPYRLSAGEWDAAATERFGEVCIDRLSELMPDLRDHIVDHRFVNPVEIEAELRMPEANITHGDMTVGSLFGARPHEAMHDYRTPLSGLYLSGSGTWPGGYITGVPGYGASKVILSDRKSSVGSVSSPTNAMGRGSHG